MNTLLPIFKTKPKVSIIAPAGRLSDYRLYVKGLEILNDLGFIIVEEKKDWSGQAYLSDSDDKRLEEFHNAWLNPDVDIIYCLRGGFGSLRIIDRINLDIVRAHPKIFIGFSDITILLNYLCIKTGLICFHGPVVTTLSSSCRPALDRLAYCLSGNWDNALRENVEILRSGPAVKGRLLGGNLSSLVTMIGTVCDPDLSDSILFLEDVNEPLYRIDRMLTQLFLSGKLNEVKGIILGNFSFDRDEDKLAALRRNEAIWNRVCELTEETAIPVWGNFPIGHCTKNLVLPVGADTTLNSSNGTLSFKAA